MTSQELVRVILKRITRFKLLILAGGIIAGVFMYLYAKTQVPIYTSYASVFPLTSPQENSASSKLSELIGGGGSTRSISEEANVSIEEVAKSLTTREVIVSERLHDFGNKMIGELLIDEYNKHISFNRKKIEKPSSEDGIISLAAAMISNSYSVKFNKNGLLEVTFSGTDRTLLIPICAVLIDKVSQFYKELKIEKAKKDYDFIQAKVDSLNAVIKLYDKERILLNNTTMFVPSDRLQYMLPKENLDNDKIRVLGQRNAAAANREDALWRLQKVTPIIKILDRPTLTSAVIKPSATMYALAGFILGCIVLVFVFIAGIIYKFVNEQIGTALAPKQPDQNTNITV